RHGGTPGQGASRHRAAHKRSDMQHDISTSPDAHVHVWSLWIDRAHHHRLVEVIQIPDHDHVRLRPVRDSHQQPPSYLEAAAQLASNYEPVRP
ncbi:MAG: hypothetical protein ACRDPA_15060, partial [Solirubrobacteraceae bacterium]